MLIRPLFIAFVFLCFSGSSYGIDLVDFNEKVNLALRETGHNLLLEQGDSTSTISPVKSEENRFSIELPKLNYDLFPYAFQEALDNHEIYSEYRVLVYKCGSEDIILGYHSNSLKQKNVTCQGRHFLDECYEVVVHFEIDNDEASALNISYWPLGLLLFIPLAFVLYNGKKTKSSLDNNHDSVPIGTYTFDISNQSLHHPNFKKQLTYRENKLLALLVNHKNQLVERKQINDQVWGDEGVIVGRSLDVFISRLRKYLNQDDNVVITNVHGVGYKLEVPN